ncbi:MAG TPA: SpoIIE family protein phosphatase, partial [Streptosporangiaceae bacterium]|nr:SpoIIE family protein phosphatase [Streptosporangiaceae bacterium]
MSIPVRRRGGARGGQAGRQRLLASLPAAAVYLTWPELVVEFANERYRDLAGGHDLAGLPLAGTLPELVAEDCFRALSQVAAAGALAPEEATVAWGHLPAGGAGARFLEFSCQPVAGPGGEVTGALLLAADVTPQVADHRRLAAIERELAKTRERHRVLLGTTPHGVIEFEADGTITGANAAAGQILGRDPARMGALPLFPASQVIHEDGSPYRPQEVPWRVAMRTGELVAGEVTGVPDRRTGEIRWLRVTTVPDARDERGRCQRGYMIMADLTESRRMEAALRESSGLLSSLREANVLGVVASTDQGVYEANDAFLDIIGYSREDLAAGRISYQTITAPEYAELDRDARAQLVRSGAFQPYDKEYLHRDGHRVPVLVGGAAVERDPLRWVTFAVDLTLRQRAEQERAALLAREQSARAQAENVQERLSFLLRAGALVAATRDRRELLEHAAQLVVPTLADHCVVFLSAGDGTLQATSLAHRDPVRAPVLAELRQHRLPASGPMSLQVAFSTGTSQLLPDAETSLAGWRGLAPGVADLLARLRAASILSIPLLVEGRPVGVLVLGRDKDWSGFVAADIAVVEEFARRLSGAIATADVFAREHTIAETLQRALLPGRLPEIGGLELAASYLPASDGVHVGGDWYDAFPLDRGGVALVIGDVAGHNISSASIMGQVRSLLRAYAIDHPDPGGMLQHANRALTRLLPEALASAFYAVLHPATGQLAYASAGHPPPLVTREPGQAAYLDDPPGAMLGATADPGVCTSTRRLPAGAGLLLYTDGLIEDRHRDLSDGLATLAAAIRRRTPVTAQQICDAAEGVL